MNRISEKLQALSMQGSVVGQDAHTLSESASVGTDECTPTDGNTVSVRHRQQPVQGSQVAGTSAVEGGPAFKADPASSQERSIECVQVAQGLEERPAVAGGGGAHPRVVANRAVSKCVGPKSAPFTARPMASSVELDASIPLVRASISLLVECGKFRFLIQSCKYSATKYDIFAAGFGGQVEPCDEEDCRKTARREVLEESANLFDFGLECFDKPTQFFETLDPPRFKTKSRTYVLRAVFESQEDLEDVPALFDVNHSLIRARHPDRPEFKENFGTIIAPVTFDRLGHVKITSAVRLPFGGYSDLLPFLQDSSSPRIMLRRQFHTDGDLAGMTTFVGQLQAPLRPMSIRDRVLHPANLQPLMSPILRHNYEHHYAETAARLVESRLKKYPMDRKTVEAVTTKEKWKIFGCAPRLTGDYKIWKSTRQSRHVPRQTSSVQHHPSSKQPRNPRLSAEGSWRSQSNSQHRPRGCLPGGTSSRNFRKYQREPRNNRSANAR